MNYSGNVSAVMMTEDYNSEEIKAILSPNEYKDRYPVFQVWDNVSWKIIVPGDYIVKTETGRVYVIKRDMFESIFKPLKN